MARIRKLGRRVVASGSLLSDEPAWRRVQIRLLSTVGAFTIFMALLAHGKMTRLFGGTVVHITDAVFVIVTVVLIVWRVRKRSTPLPEPKDEELELPPGIVEEQLASGALQPRDLVFERGIWGTLADSQQFSLAAEAPVARERSRAQRLMIVQVAIGLVFAVAAVLFIFNLGSVVRWLAS